MKQKKEFNTNHKNNLYNNKELIINKKIINEIYTFHKINNKIYYNNNYEIKKNILILFIKKCLNYIYIHLYNILSIYI